MAIGTSVEVAGLKELSRSLGKIDKELRKDLNRELRRIGDRVRDTARGMAAARRASGDEVRGIKTSVSRNVVRVVSKAEHGGVNYPRIHEFKGRGANDFGPRAVLLPAVTKHRAESERDIERLLDNVLRGF